MPPVCVRFSVEEKLELFVETSKFAGAVTVISAARSVPLTVKDWAAEAVPELAEKPVRLAGVAEMVGVATNQLMHP